MPAIDKIHDAVKNALVKDGWTITADPYVLEYEDARLFADLAAERPVAVEPAGRIVVVEIKSFSGASAFHDFETALGQYLLYRRLLKATAPDCKLYLAISDTVYGRVFERKSIQVTIQEYEVALLVVNTATEEIIRWTS